MAELPRIARYKPYYVELDEGRRVFWCSCGLSDNQPFCDGSHRGTEFTPLPVVADGEREVLLCGCKHTKTPPYCDGSHNNLRDHYDEEDPDSEENRRVPLITENSHGRTLLDGGCFVARMESLRRHREGPVTWARVIGAEQGAVYQSQFYLTVAEAGSPAISFGEADVVLFVLAGEASLQIGERRFELEPSAGAHVRCGESFQLLPQRGQTLECYVSVRPATEAPTFSLATGDTFDTRFPERVQRLSEENRVPMGDRFFQILVGEDMGCRAATQFIGDIPQSKAARHRHLYEESLILVSGEGMMWTENGKTPVHPGDVIFLPRKQEHSLECVSPGGMRVAGVIHPGDNPAINY